MHEGDVFRGPLDGGSLMESKLLLDILSSVIATGLTCIVSPGETTGQLISGVAKLLPNVLDHYLEKTKVEEKLIKAFRKSVIEALSAAEIEMDYHIMQKIAGEFISNDIRWENLGEKLADSFEKYDVWLENGLACEAEEIAADIRTGMNHTILKDRQLREFINFVRLELATEKLNDLSKKLDLNEQEALSCFREARYPNRIDVPVNCGLFPDLIYLEKDTEIRADTIHSPLSVYFKNELCGMEMENGLIQPARILLSGPGGTGKTFAMQDLMCSLLEDDIYAIYISLPLINVYRSIFDYMAEIVFSRDSHKTQVFYEKYGNSSRMVYLLDGYNEVSEENQSFVNQQIQELFRGDAHIVIASRIRLPYALNANITTTMAMQPLNKETIISCMAGGKSELPNRSNNIWELLDTPLLLVLYTQLENHFQKYYRLDEWNKNNTKAAIIWNSFQCEYFKVAREGCDQGDNLDLLWYSVYYVIPYISWKMVSLESFYIKSAAELNKWIAECISIRDYQERKGSLRNGFFDISIDKCDSKKIIKILTGLLIPSSFGEDKGYGFRHQNFRDCLAAVHCLNMIDSRTEKAPSAWKDIVLPEDILQYIIELDEEGRVEALWKRTGDGQAMTDPGYTIYNMVEFYKIKYQHDLSGLHFTGQDLRSVSLNGVKLCSEKQYADFRRARIYESTFLPQGHRNYINCMVVTSDGKYAVSGSKDGQIIKWDIKTGNVAGGPWHVEGDVRSIAIAPGDKYMLWGGSSPTIHKWDLVTGAELCKPWNPWEEDKGNYVCQIYITLDGRYALAVDFHTHSVLLDTVNGNVTGGVPIPYASTLEKVIFTPDNRCAVGSSGSGDLFKWEILTGELIWVAKGACTFYHFELTVDGNYVICIVEDGIFRIWDADNGKLAAEYRLFEECSDKSMVLTPDGRYAVLNNGLVRLEIQSGKLIGLPFESIAEELTELVITPDGRFIIGCTFQNNIYKWDTATGGLAGKAWRLWNASVTDLAVSEGSEYFFSAAEDGLLTKWNMKTGLPVWVSEKKHKSSINCIRLTSDEMYLLSGSADGTIIKWNTDRGTAEGEPWTAESEMGEVCALDITPDGQYVITGSKDKKFRKWKFSTGVQVGGPWEGYYIGESNIKISRDGQYFFCGLATSISEENNIQVWSVETGEQICPGWPRYFLGNAKITLSSDGSTIFGGTPNGTMFNVDVSKVERYMYIKKFGYGIHLSDVTSIALTTDSGYIYSAASNGEIGKWYSWGFFTEIFLNITPAYASCIQIFADNNRLIAGCNDGTIRIWDLKTKELLQIFCRIPNCNICGCQFQGALFENKELRSIIKSSGGVTEYLNIGTL